MQLTHSGNAFRKIIFQDSIQNFTEICMQILTLICTLIFLLTSLCASFANQLFHLLFYLGKPDAELSLVLDISSSSGRLETRLMVQESVYLA